MSVLAAIAEWIAHVGLAAVQVLSWFGLGSLLLRPLTTGVPAVDALNRLGAGAVGFALLTFALGWAGLLHPELFVPATVVAAVGGGLAARRTVRGLTLPRLADLPRAQAALALLLATTIALAAVVTGAPVVGFDALTYHVTVPVLYEEHHRILEVPWNWSSYQPFTVEMLITDGVLLWDPVQGAFAVFALSLGALAAVVVGTRLIGRPGLALLAGAIFFVQPLVAWEATASLVEGGMAFAVALAALNLFVAARTRHPAALVAAGIFAGAAAGMKYVGLFVALATGVAVLLAAERGRRLASAASFALPALLVASPWYAKNWILTGNPVFPFVFGGAREGVVEGIEATVRDFGYGRGPDDALLLPVRLLANSEAFDGSGWLSPLILVFPLLALLDRPLRRGVWIALAGCAVFWGCWFVTAQQARFLLPTLPVLSVLAALGICVLARAGRTGRTLATAGTTLALGVAFATFAVYCVPFVPVVAGVQSEEAFLEDRTAFYDGVEWLNREVPESDAVLIDFNSPYLERPYVVWSPLVVPDDPADARRFVRDEELRYAALLAELVPGRRRHLTAMGARRVAAIDVHTAYLGIRRWGGIPHRLVVYRLEAVPASAVEARR